MTLFGFFSVCALLCIVGVTVSLFWGLVTMTKQGDADRLKSNKLMRMRVFFQGLALLFLLLAYLAK